MEPGEARGRILLARRGGGSKFAAKAARARQAGARALIVVQSSEGDPVMKMTGEGTDASTLAAAMVAFVDGERLIRLAADGAVAPRLTLAARRGPATELPPNRPCAMSAESTDALWIGFLHAHFSDSQLEAE